MQRWTTRQPLFSPLRALHSASALLGDLVHQLGARQYSRQAHRPSRPPEHGEKGRDKPNLGQLCREFQEAARQNKVRQAEQLHEAYLAAGGKPKLWMANMLIGVYARKREVKKAFAVYQQILQQEKEAGAAAAAATGSTPEGASAAAAAGAANEMSPNVFTYGNLLNVLAKAEHPPYDLSPDMVARAEALFQEMLQRGVVPNQVAYHTLMDVQAKAAQPAAAFATYRSMLAAGLQPNATTFAILMAACGRAGDHRGAAEVMERLMPQAGVAPTTATWNSMLGAYAKSGSVDGAYATWVRMLESGAIPDAYTERALIDALASHPALAADVVAEARQIRQRLAAAQAVQQPQSQHQQGQRQQQQSQWSWQRRGTGAAGEGGAAEGTAPGGWEEGAGSGFGGVAGGQHGGKRYSTPLRQGELQVDDFESSSTTPLAGTAYGTELYRPSGSSSASSSQGAWDYLPAGGTGGQPSAGAGGPAAARDSDAGQQQQQQQQVGLDLRSLFWLDLHGMSQAAARASLLRRLEMLVNLAQELVIQVQREQQAQQAQQEQQAHQQQQQQEEEQQAEVLAKEPSVGRSSSQLGGGRGGPSLSTRRRPASLIPEEEVQQPAKQPPLSAREQQQQQPMQPPQQQREWGRERQRERHALVIVTGVGRHSKAAGAGVLKAAVTQLLDQHGIPWREEQLNPGRVLVPWPGLCHFVQTQRDAMQTDHFFSVARARYTYIAAGVAGLVAAAYIVPRLAPWMPP